MTHPRPVLGILGGGQLAQMLLDASRKLGVQTRVLVQNAQEPAALRASPSELQVAPGGDEGTLRAFLKPCTHAIFENEFSDLDLFARASHPELIWAPGLGGLSPLQDKLEQKRLLAELKIAHAPASEDLSDAELDGHAAKGFVLKWARYGYDGGGTRILAPKEWSRGAMREQCRRFVAEGERKGSRVFWEKRLDVRAEFSTVGCRSRDGKVAHYPVVQSFQESGICREVWGPATLTAKLTPAQGRALQTALEKLARRLSWVGVLAIEWIQDRKGKFWVNEIAPRVHNTAHWTQDAGVTSQFENHIRAALGWNLGSTDWQADHARGAFFGMRNVLGPEAGAATSWNPSELADFAHLHWYGKSEVRPRRKLGHINVVGTPTQKWTQIRAQLTRLEQEAWWPAKK